MLFIRGLAIQNAGSVIGRAGTTVRAFREESTAKINVSDTVLGAPDRIITVSGLPTAVAKAYMLVAAKLEETRQVSAAPLRPRERLQPVRFHGSRATVGVPACGVAGHVHSKKA